MKKKRIRAILDNVAAGLIVILVAAFFGILWNQSSENAKENDLLKEQIVLQSKEHEKLKNFVDRFAVEKDGKLTLKAGSFIYLNESKLSESK